VKGDWTAQLAADHAPPPVGLWPLAAGWWGVLGVCLLLLAWAFAWRRRVPTSRSSLRSLKRAALAEIERIEQSAAEDPVIARELETVLRRYALALFGAQRVARLTGPCWLQFLGQHGGTLLAGDTGRRLLEAAFAQRAGNDRDAWFRACREFLQRPRNEPG
jgi:Domain of unknown function (DUF4381)